MSNRRVEILCNVLALRSLGGSPSDFFRNLLAPPCKVLADRRIERIEQAVDNTLAIYIQGRSRPLYFPAEFDLRFLHQVLAEETYKWNWHYYQIPQTRVGPDDVVMDCGAAEGFFSLMACEQGAKKVICLEPHPGYLRGLRLTFGSDDRVTLIAAAAGNATGSIRLSDEGIASTLTEKLDGTIPVKVETIDQLCSSLNIHPTYIKADIEGYEEKMLEGAARTIAAFRPKLALTTYHHQSAGGWMEQFLKGLYPKYKIRLKGLASQQGATVMLHAWTE